MNTDKMIDCKCVLFPVKSFMHFCSGMALRTDQVQTSTFYDISCGILWNVNVKRTKAQ